MSFLKQLLNPFIEFDEETKRQNAEQGKAPVPPQAPVAKPSTAAPQPAPVNPLPAAKPQQPAADENAQHPLITGAGASPAANQVPTYSPGGTIAGPLPEHHQYFEKLIND